MPDTSWNDLLSWLEKHGFDKSTLSVDLHESPAGGGRKLVATTDIFPQQTLIQLPNSTLLHRATVTPLYDASLVESLSAIQLICLHLALHRHSSSSSAAVDLEDFVPYIRTLPQDFSTVPLWREVVKDEAWAEIMKEGALLPQGLKATIEDVSKRFWKDWTHTSYKWSTNSSRTGADSLNVEDFAWAWLCVNSRCIYYDLELPTREDNITLAPIIDMGNHSPGQPTKIVQHDEHFALVSSGFDSHISDWSSMTILTSKGSEVMYSYSSLSEYALFAEYGFVLGMPANKDSVLDVTARVVEMFEELEEEEKELKKSILQANDYWGEYHFILSEGEVDVSYRLTMALALYHMHPSQASSKATKRTTSPRKRSKTEQEGVNRDQDVSGWDLQPFYDLVNGMRDEISEENVKALNATLVRLCEDVQAESKAALERLKQHPQAGTSMVSLLKAVWEGELWFAEQYFGMADKQ